MQLLTWRFSTTQLPRSNGAIAALHLDPTAIPGLFEHLDDGWSPISHTLAPIGDDVLLSILMIRSADVVIPDSAEGLTSSNL